VEPTVDAVGARERAQLTDGIALYLEVPQAFVLSEQRDDRIGVEPRRRCEATVPAARSAADDVLLEDDDPHAGGLLRQPDGGP